MPKKTSPYEGQMYVELFNIGYCDCFCTLKDDKFIAYERKTSAGQARKLLLELDASDGCEAKQITLSVSALSRLMKLGTLPAMPYFFLVTCNGQSVMMAVTSEMARRSWIASLDGSQDTKGKKKSNFKSKLKTPSHNDSDFGGSDDEASSGDELTRSNRRKTMLSSSPSRYRQVSSNANDTGDNFFSSSGGKGMKKGLSSSHNAANSSKSPRKTRAQSSDTTPSENNVAGISNMKNFQAISKINNSKNGDATDKITVKRSNSSSRDIYNVRRTQLQSTGLKLLEEEEEVVQTWSSKMFSKLDPLVRLFKVVSAFPFIIVVATLDLSSFSVLRSAIIVRVMNALIYIIPVVFVNELLSQTSSPAVARLAMSVYIGMYLLPVGMNVFWKLKVSSNTSKIEEGTFCFKPARSVRWTSANAFAMYGFIMEWLQHCLYVLPLGVVASKEAATISSFPPYLPFYVYFWGSVASVYVCAIIIILNAVLRGKNHYRFQRSGVIWYLLFNLGGPFFVTIVTILFMGLWCDNSVEPPTLVQDPTVICWQSEHTNMAIAALAALAVYIIQNTLLPSGTFKETMRDNDLEIMFVPVYLQAHFLMKAIFCGVYVTFYTDNYVRIIGLTVINVILLALNVTMKPCSVEWVNMLRDTFFMHAALSGIQSLNYLAWPETLATKGLLITTLASNLLFVCVGMYVYFVNTSRSTEYAIALAFLDLEWQVSRGGSAVHPRVLEPLISLTLSTEPEDIAIAKKYIAQMVSLLGYPNMRVQFQASWGLANLALTDNDARIQIHEADGTKRLFECFTGFDFVVQLETLAALANLSLSFEVCEIMVGSFNCIPFFLGFVASNKMKHAQFSTIALGNLARVEEYREIIRSSGGIQILVGCIMSHDYQKKRYGCLALANVALSQSRDIEQVFESRGLLDRIIKMALRKEIETQMEVMSLIRNLSCHVKLRPMLLDRGVMKAVEASRASVYEDVRNWCEEITCLLEMETNSILSSFGAQQAQSTLSATQRAANNRGSTRFGFGGMRKSALERSNTLSLTLNSLSEKELLQRMTPLSGEVNWSTWGSKLENIFASVFSTIPSLQDDQVVTPVNEPIVVFLAKGLSKSLLNGWRDNMSYNVTTKPTHGVLSDYSTSNDYLTYTPNEKYLGSDFFTYYLKLGSMNTAPATIALTVSRFGGTTKFTASVEDPMIEESTPKAPSGGGPDDIEMGFVRGTKEERKEDVQEIATPPPRPNATTMATPSGGIVRRGRQPVTMHSHAGSTAPGTPH